MATRAHGTKSTADFLYEEVAERVTSLIGQGTLVSGDPVPSVRKMSRQAGVSVATVVQAYALLESRGLIHAKPQSGYYVRFNPKELLEEPVLSAPTGGPTLVGVNSIVTKVLGAMGDPSMVPLGAAIPALELFPTARLGRLIHRVCREGGEAAYGYDPVPGLLRLRQKIALRSLDWGGRLHPDEIVTTGGCMEALNLCLRAVTGPGDTVAIESPTYFSILQMLESLQVKALEIPTHPRDGMDLDALERELAGRTVKACIVQTNFQNPLGCSMPDAHKKRLVDLLAKRDIPLIEDDLYGELHFGPVRPKAAKAFDRKGLVLYCSSFSKCLWPGARVGWAAAGRFHDKVSVLKQMSSISTPTLPQRVIAEYMDDGGYDRHLRSLRRALERQMRQVAAAVRAHFPEGTRMTRPEGGFVLWIELPEGSDSLRLDAEARKAGISIAPGPMFSAHLGHRAFLRLSCGNPWSERIEKAVIRLGLLAKDQAKDPLRARPRPR